MDGVMADVYHQLVQFEKETQEERSKSEKHPGSRKQKLFPMAKAMSMK